MADLTPKRIYELTEQTEPLDGWAAEVSKEGNTDQKLVLSKHFTYEEKVEIGTWNLQSTPLLNKTISNIDTVDRIEAIKIFDDDGLEYDGMALFDNWMHGAKRKAGYQSSKTVNITGNTSSNSAGTTNEGQGTNRRLLFSGQLNPDPSWGRVNYRDTAFLVNIPSVTKYDTGGKKGYTVTHNLGSQDYDVRITNMYSDTTRSQVGVTTVLRGPNSFTVFLYDAATNVFYNDTVLFVEIVSIEAEKPHTHTTGQHSHTVEGSGITGSITPESGFRFKSVQVIHRLDRANARVQLTHNVSDDINMVMTSFGVFTIATNDTVLTKFKTAAATGGNRGYIIVKRKFKVV